MLRTVYRPSSRRGLLDTSVYRLGLILWDIPTSIEKVRTNKSPQTWQRWTVLEDMHVSRDFLSRSEAPLECNDSDLSYVSNFSSPNKRWHVSIKTVYPLSGPRHSLRTGGQGTSLRENFSKGTSLIYLQHLSFSLQPLIFRSMFNIVNKREHKLKYSEGIVSSNESKWQLWWSICQKDW